MAADPGYNDCYYQIYTPDEGTNYTLVYCSTNDTKSQYGTLDSSGNANEDWGWMDVPWYSLRSKITRVVVHDKIHPLNGQCHFAILQKVTEIENIENFDTSDITSFYQMFFSNSKLTTLDLSSWNVSNVTTMYQMFYGCTHLSSLNIEGWNTSSLTSTGAMFQAAKGFTTLDISSLDTQGVTNMTGMFMAMGSQLTTIYVGENFVTTSVTSSANMFTNDTGLVGGNGTVYDANYVDATYARIDTAVTPGYFSVKPTTLPIEYNGTTLKKIYFNGTEIKSLYYNGTKIF